LNKTLTNILYVSAADIVVKVVSASTTFLVAKLLSPAEYGTWITLMLVVSYAPIVSLGTVETLLKQYPFYVGKGDIAMAAMIEGGVLGSIILSSALLLIGGLAVSSILATREIGNLINVIALMLLTASLTFLSAFSYYRFSARQRFRFVSAIDAGRATLTFACLVGLTWLWGLNGTVGGFLVAELTICVVSGWLCVKQCGRVTVSYDPRLMWRIVKVGFPITLIWWVFIIQSSADRLISMSLLGETRTGFYGLGLSIVSLVVLLPVTLSRVLYPRVNEKIGQTAQEQHLRSLIMIPSQALSILIPTVIGLLVIASPVVYKRLLPKYSAGLTSAQILLLGSFFMCIVRTGANFLIATNRQSVVLRYILTSLTINILGNILLARLGYGIEGIAFGSSVSACVLATLVWLAVFKHLGSGRTVQMRELADLYLPYLLMLSLLALYEILVPGVFADPSPHLAVLSVTFVLMFSMILYMIPTVRVRSMGIFGLLKANIRNKVAA
jgi:teichuronic acid exporter